MKPCEETKKKIIKAIRDKGRRQQSRGPGGEYTTWYEVAGWLEKKDL